MFWRKNGSPVWVEYTSTPIRDRGTVVGAVIVFRDVSHRREADEKLHAALAEVDRLRERLELENAYLQEEIRIETNPRGIIGQSEAIQKTLRQVKLVAPTTAAVMITGKSGTGKELIARAIHEASNRRDRPLIRVNCAAIPRELFESEFFGHVKGAFTGAVRDRIGRFELADGGTLFLDEVGEIPLELQGKLLRVLQEGNFERVGEERTRAVDVRVIAATNRNLKQEVQRGRFREDLYFRLNVFPVESVPLRDRREDIPLLAQHFLMSESNELKSDLRLSEGDARRLQRYDWPGNVRELQNVIERAAILSQNGRLRIDLPDTAGRALAVQRRPAEGGGAAGGHDLGRDARPRARQYPGRPCRLQRQGVRRRRRRRDAGHQADHAGLAHEGARVSPRPRRQARGVYDDFLILKLVEIVLGLGRVESLAHHRERFVGGRRRRQAHLLHHLGGIGREKDLLGHRLVVDIALDLAPALHLGQHPDREGLPGERIEVDALGVGLDAAESVGVGAGQHLLEHGDRRVDVVRRRDRLRDLLAVLRLRGVGGGIDDRPRQRRKAVRRLS